MSTARPLSLRIRIVASTALAVAVLLLALGGVATRILQLQAQVVLHERLQVAEVTASRLDTDLAADLSQLKTLASTGATKPASVGNLRVFNYAVIRLDRFGRVLWTVPQRPADEVSALMAPLSRTPALRGGQAAWTDLLRTPKGPTVIGVAEPVPGSGVVPGGTLVGLIDLRTQILEQFISGSLPEGQTAHAVVLDREGWVLACTGPSPLFTREEHPEFFSAVIQAGQPRLGLTADDQPPPQHIMAAAPLRNAPWAVGVGQAEWEAMAPVTRLRWLLILFGLVAVALAAGYSWWDTGMVIRPLVQLTRAAQEVARGNLEEPVRVQRRDEIGALGAAFDSMRLKLRESRAELQSLAVYEERDRIAREMHDSVAQSLGYIYSRLRLLQERYPPKEASETWAELDELARVTSASYDEVRWAIFGLRTRRPHRVGLLSALAGFLRDFTARTGVPAELAGETLGRVSLAPQGEAQLVRIVQEALTNVAKHAAASRVWVRAEAEGDSVRVSVEDNGTGFDPTAESRGGDGHFGLASMRERAESVGGRLEIDSRPGAGCRIHIQMPLVE